MAHYNGIPGKFIRLITNIYDNSGGQILRNGKLSQFFKILTGIRQGCLCSPFLFLLVIDWVMKQSTSSGNTGIQWTLTGKLKDLDYADDLALLSHTKEQIQRKTNNIINFSSKVGLNINVPKTKVMKMNAKNENQININNVCTEDVSKFTYHGSVDAPGGGTEEDIKSRINKGVAFYQLNKVWRSSVNRLRTKLKLFNSNVKSVLL